MQKKTLTIIIFLMLSSSSHADIKINNGGIDASQTYQAGGTAGLSIDCASDQLLQEVVISKGIITAASCAAEGDPKINILGNGKWCKSNGSTINCDQDNVTILETDPQIGANALNKVPKWNGTALVEGWIVDTGTNVGISDNRGTLGWPQRKFQLGNETDGIGLEPSDGSPNSGYIRFGDNTGRKLFFGSSRDSAGGVVKNLKENIFMTIKDNGNVGFNLPDPFDPDSTIEIGSITGAVAPAIRLQHTGANWGTAGGFVEFYDNSSIGGWFGYANDSLPSGDFYVANKLSGKHILVRTNGADRMIIGTNGSVGIGTTAPSQKLHVNGGNVVINGTIFSGGPQDGNKICRKDGTNCPKGVVLPNMECPNPQGYRVGYNGPCTLGANYDSYPNPVAKPNTFYDIVRNDTTSINRFCLELGYSGAYSKSDGSTGTVAYWDNNTHQWAELTSGIGCSAIQCY